jgi:hypothetical protein
MKSIGPLEARIKFFILKCKIKKDLAELAMVYRLNEIRKKLGEKLASVDPYGEEDWNN